MHGQFLHLPKTTWADLHTWHNCGKWFWLFLQAHLVVRGDSQLNLIKSFGRCALNITTLDALIRIAMAKIHMKSLDFEDSWERWMSVKDRRFQEVFRLWVSYIFQLLLSCCPRDYYWIQYVEMSLPFQFTQTSMFH